MRRWPTPTNTSTTTTETIAAMIDTTITAPTAIGATTVPNGATNAAKRAGTLSVMTAIGMADDGLTDRRRLRTMGVLALRSAITLGRAAHGCHAIISTAA